MSPIINVPGRKVWTRKQARDEAGFLLCLGIVIIICAWVFLPGYANSPSDALFASIVVSLFGGMVIGYSIYLFARSSNYPETEAEGNPEN
ncbi:MAG: hypothetical protein ACFFCS_06095 [Candidatus Hodarchaeota archaeon]